MSLVNVYLLTSFIVDILQQISFILLSKTSLPFTVVKYNLKLMQDCELCEVLLSRLADSLFVVFNSDMNSFVCRRSYQ